MPAVATKGRQEEAEPPERAMGEMNATLQPLQGFENTESI